MTVMRWYLCPECYTTMSGPDQATIAFCGCGRTLAAADLLLESATADAVRREAAGSDLSGDFARRFAQRLEEVDVAL